MKKKMHRKMEIIVYNDFESKNNIISLTIVAYILSKSL